MIEKYAVENWELSKNFKGEYFVLGEVKGVFKKIGPLTNIDFIGKMFDTSTMVCGYLGKSK